MKINSIGLTARWYDLKIPDDQAQETHIMPDVKHTNAGYEKNFMGVQLDVPFSLSRTPLSQDHIRNLNTINEKEGILKTTTGVEIALAKFTLRYAGFHMTMDMDEDGDVTYHGWYQYHYRPDGFWKIVRTEREDKYTGKVVPRFYKILQYEAKSWNEPTEQSSNPS